MPIELVWHEMKDYVRTKFCKTIEDLAFAVQDFVNSQLKNVKNIYSRDKK
jgi:dihydroneopterin aldolase